MNLFFFRRSDRATDWVKISVRNRHFRNTRKFFVDHENLPNVEEIGVKCGCFQAFDDVLDIITILKNGEAVIVIQFFMELKNDIKQIRDKG